MVNKKSLPREDRKHLREFLSFNPFFKEMESHLHKMAYGKNVYSDEHLCLEQMWLLAIDFLHKSNLVITTRACSPTPCSTSPNTTPTPATT